MDVGSDDRAGKSLRRAEYQRDGALLCGSARGRLGRPNPNVAMIADLPQALANVLSAMERDRLRYVLYRDPTSDRRVVILVEGPDDLAALEAALRDAGAEDTSPNSHLDFVLRSSESDAEPAHFVIHMESGSGKSTIANLLWLAATNEGAAAARNSLDRSS